VLACLLPLEAQVVVSVRRLPNGSSQITIRNNSAGNLEAFGISANASPAKDEQRDLSARQAPFLTYSDPTIDPAAEPVAPNQERVVPALLVCAAPGKRAVFYSGDAEAATLLRDRAAGGGWNLRGWIHDR
jgi:hypothetical protein